MTEGSRDDDLRGRANTNKSAPGRRRPRKGDSPTTERISRPFGAALSGVGDANAD